MVDCPEFLVHFPTLVRLAEQHGLMMIGKQRFQNFFNAKKDAQDGRMLLSRMNALETFPSRCALRHHADCSTFCDRRKTVGPEEQYEHVAQFKDGQEVHHYHDQEHHDEHVFLHETIIVSRLLELSPRTNGKLSLSTLFSHSRR